MGELWDVYDSNKRKTGRIAERGVDVLDNGEYHIVVQAVIINSKNELLISKRAAHKKYGLMWEMNGGSILKGETSLEGMIRELREELGINVSKREAIFLKYTTREKSPANFKDFWLFRKDVDIKDITFPDGEAVEAKWVSIEEYLELIEKKEIVPTIEFNEEDYNTVLNMKNRESYSYIGKNVKVKIDRPLNSNHPKHGFKYPVNYGYIENTVSGDGEELDCYVLGIDEPIEDFEGECIGVIYRINDDDDKLIVVKNGQNYTDDEIRSKTDFQEQFFVSEIIR
ncbi:MAG: NUDIX domain-containing protein [Clostridia bacterium]|nr:NUDIX domain-containing protein [Clostridia bacterium]